MIETHDMEMVRSGTYLEDGTVFIQGFAAMCSCGWEHDDTFATKEAATEAWDNHCDQAFFEATS